MDGWERGREELPLHPARFAVRPRAGFCFSPRNNALLPRKGGLEEPGIARRSAVMFTPKILSSPKEYSWKQLGAAAVAGVVVGVGALPPGLAFPIPARR